MGLLRRVGHRSLLIDDRGDGRSPHEVEADLYLLSAHVGGPLAHLAWARSLELRADWFDEEKRVAELDWCVHYLLRHGRWPDVSALEAMTKRELDRHVRVVSDMIEAENKPRKR